MEWTNERGKEARVRCDAATKGPWEQDAHYVTGNVKGGRPGGEVIVQCHSTASSVDDRARDLKNSEFIAHARTDLPDALDEIDRQRKRIADLEAETKGFHDRHGYDFIEGQRDEARAEAGRWKMLHETLRIESGLRKCSCCGCQRIFFYMAMHGKREDDVCAWCLNRKARAERDTWREAQENTHAELQKALGLWEKLKAERTALRKALGEYGWHKLKCNRFGHPNTYDCNCDWEEKRKKLLEGDSDE